MLIVDILNVMLSVLMLSARAPKY